MQCSVLLLAVLSPLLSFKKGLIVQQHPEAQCLFYEIIIVMLHEFFIRSNKNHDQILYVVILHEVNQKISKMFMIPGAKN